MIGGKNMEIKKGALVNLDAVAALEAACFPPAEAATRESLARRLAAWPHHFWLLWDGEELVSCVNGLVTDEGTLRDEMYEDAGLHDEGGAWQMIFGVTTAPARRGQGCASRLLCRVIDDARAQGRRGLVLTCKEALLPFYGALGFVSEGVSPSVHGGAVWYQMRLTF